MYELVQVSENCFYIQCPAKIGVVKTGNGAVVSYVASRRRTAPGAGGKEHDPVVNLIPAVSRGKHME